MKKLPLAAKGRIVKAGLQVRREMEAYITEFANSCEMERYLPAFIRFGQTLFDAYAREYLKVRKTEDEFRSVLTDEVIPIVTEALAENIEQLFPGFAKYFNMPTEVMKNAVIKALKN